MIVVALLFFLCGWDLANYARLHHAVDAALAAMWLASGIYWLVIAARAS